MRLWGSRHRAARSIPEWAFRLVLLGVVPGTLAAQDTIPVADTTARQLPELVVQADRLALEGIPLDRLPIPAEVRRYDAATPGGTWSVADLTQGMVGVSFGDQFGSPFQPDLRFRGYQVGPVVGYPHSVSVFVDGVRVNEPDASQVNFNLIPLHAIERVEVIRGPGGPFGRNTLAGAINFVTRSGQAGPARGTLAASGGTLGTGEAQGWAGGGAGAFNWLFSGRYHYYDGWRDLSETELRQFFGKIGHRTERTDLSLSYTFADDYVEGPGSLPTTWLEGELPPELLGSENPRRLQYTGGVGDIFTPQLHFINANLRQTLTPVLDLSLNTFLRSNDFTQLNDNITEANTRGETGITSYGATAQLGRRWASGASLTGGAEFIRNEVDIGIFAEPNPNFPDAGGQTESVVTDENNFGVFTQLYLPTSERVSWLGALRYDHVRLPVTDLLDPENSGVNTFNRITGSIGVDLKLSEQANVYGNFGRGFRAPVILEVSCADPEDPCPLPFELGADPPLDPVTTNTWQAGLRLNPSPTTRLEAVAYWAEVYGDLFNVVADPPTRGYFKNVEKTRRQGAELSLVSVVSNFELRGNLGLVRATFQSNETLASALLDDDDEEEPGEPEPPPEEPEEPEEEEGGPVVVSPGDHFAVTPQVTAELGATYFSGPWSFGLEGEFVGSQYFVGDEDNTEEFGKLDSYFVFNASIEREIGLARVFLIGQNLLDSEYETFGLVARNVRGPEDDPQPFVTPSLPFRLVGGVRVQF
jgi:iron complex outermembrane recepter protein